MCMSMISQLTARVADPGVDAMALNWSLLTWKLKIDLWLIAEILTAELADMGCVLARGCDSCTHEPEVSESELADMGCVLARGCDSCTHEPEVSESELADMGCVLAKGCDSCTHESGFSEGEVADMGCVLARSCDSCILMSHGFVV